MWNIILLLKKRDVHTYNLIKNSDTVTQRSSQEENGYCIHINGKQSKVCSHFLRSWGLGLTWVQNNRCFWTRVLDKALDNLLDCKEINPEYSLERLMMKLKLQYFGHWCEELTHWKRFWCWERLRAGGEGSNRGWDGWMPSLTQWTWVWANPGKQGRTGEPGVLQSMGSQSQTWLYEWTTTITVVQAIQNG